MQKIRIAVVRDSQFRSGDGFEVFGDAGGGEVDWVHPVTPRRMLFWDGALAMVPHVLAGHLMGFHLDSMPRDGHLYGTHLMDRQMLPAGTVVFEGGPFVFGRFQHVVVTQDEVGNCGYEGVTVYSKVVNSYPPSARDLRVESYDYPTGVATFSFKPSERLVG